MKKLLQSLFILMLFAVTAMAQERTITGTVTSSDDKLPIPGVSVKVKGTSVGVSTSATGAYSLSVPSGATTLVFSSLGFTTKEISLGGSSTVNASLVLDTKQLSEVVITGALGIQRQKKEIGYAATSVNNATLTSAKAVNVANGLQGKVSGLNIVSTNSGVFENVKINLRGIRSLTGNNNPLLLLDGVQTDIDYMSSINPNDIADVTILKGASAAAVYGSDAKNGVIVITTKNGTSDGKPVITVGNSTQFQEVSFFPKLQREFGLGGGGGSANTIGAYVPIENWSWGPRYDGSQVQIGPDYRAGGIDLDNQMVTYSDRDDRQKFYDTGNIIQNDVSYADKNLFFSFQDANIKGIVPNDKNRRTGIRFNGTKEYGKFKIAFNSNYSQQNYNVFDSDGMSDFNTSQGIGLNQGLMNLLFNTAGYIPLKSFKDYQNNPYAQYNNYYTDYGMNPYEAIGNWRKTGKRADLITNLNLNFKVTDWLTLNYRAALNTVAVDERRTSQGEISTPFGVGVRGFNTIPGNLEERSFRSQRLSSEAFASVNKQLNSDFKLTADLGTYYRQDDSRDTRVGAVNLVVTDLYNISQRTGNLTGTSSGRKSRLLAFFARAGISYKGWANIEISGRNEQTSLLDPSQNSYFYPGVSGSFVLSDALPALKSGNFLSYLKLRGGWNQTANADIAPYALSPTFSQSAGFPYGGLAGYTAGNATADPLLKPERIEATEAGIEAGFWKNRINFEATYFHYNNTDQIIPIDVSQSTGYTSYRLNAASFISQGVELDLGLTPLVNLGEVKIDLRTNATYTTSEVTSIFPGLDQLSIPGGYTYAGNYAITGAPAFVIKATDYNRDDQGRVIVNKATGAPTANPNTVIFGNTLPKWIVGITPSVRWKGLTLSGVLEYKTGYFAYADIGNAMSWTGVSELSAINSREKFVFPNSSYLENGQYVANTSATLNNPEGFFSGVARSVASNYIIDASSWRFRELSLNYDVPVKFFGNQNVIKGLKVAFVARNLALWLPKSNTYTDPEFTSSPGATSFGNGNTTGLTTGNQAGISNSSINPPVRTIGGNIILTF